MTGARNLGASALLAVRWLLAAGVCWGGGLPVHAADALAASEFAWRGAVAPADGSSLVRLALPPDALARLQTHQAQDVRVFNAAGAVVPYAVLPVADLEHTAPQVQTRLYPAWPLYSPTSPEATADKGSLEIRWSPDGSATSAMAWVRPGTQGVPGGTRLLPAALLDLRTESQTLSALELKGNWPRNALVHIELASSTDLQDWTPIALKGPVFRFDGSDAPANTALDLQQPQSFQGRYLRLRWAGQDGVRLSSVTGRVATARQAAEPVRLDVGEGTPEGAFARVWSLPFATPVLALHIEAVQDNTLVPLRISGRADATKPWRLLASTVVYRMDTVAGGRSNPAQPLPDTALRQLRLETSNGVPLPAGGLRLSADLAPVQVAFLASGSGPFLVAAGRADTAFAGVDAATLASASATPLPSLPFTPVRQLRADLPGAPQLWAASLLPANVSLRSAVLWAVLLIGVSVMASVAYALLRQLNAAPAGGAAAGNPPKS
jgi:hypothetical protein